MKAKAAERAGGSIGLQTERRIGWLTVVFGFVATAVVLVLRHKLWAAGLAIGTALGWLNFRWLRRAVDALVIVSTAQADREKARVPLTAYLAALFRYGLLGLDRKSTRLNSSHSQISYAVFCLKKKKITTTISYTTAR